MNDFAELKYAALIADNPYVDFDEILVVLSDGIPRTANWLGTHVLKPKGYRNRIARFNIKTGYGKKVAHVTVDQLYPEVQSEGIQLLEKGHHGVGLDDDSWRRLYTWIDLNLPFHGSWSSVYGWNRIANIASRAAELRSRYAAFPPENS